MDKEPLTKLNPKTDWKLSEVWNKAISDREERPMTPRSRIWASELGKSDIDVFLKMKGEPETNPFDVRAYRKFEAGNLFEWVVEMVLKRCGIYQSSQDWLSNEDFGLQVTGKLDFIAGGKPEYDSALQGIKELGLPYLFTRATDHILNHFLANYPDGLENHIIEVKSTSSYGIEKVYETGEALAGHDLQVFHCARIKQLPSRVLYLSKDDLRMAEVSVNYKDPEMLAKYQTKIEGLARYYKNDEEPPKEPEVLFDESSQKFTKNFNVEYSSYLTRNYGYKEAGDYFDKWTPIVASWNRVIGRLKEGKELTDKNKAKIAEMAEYGFDVMEIKNKLTATK